VTPESKAAPEDGVTSQPQAPPGEAGVQGVIRKALTSESFVEKVALLLLTAILTAVMAPLIVHYINFRDEQKQKAIETTKAREYEVAQKAVEAMRAKEDSILKAQSKLLDDVAEVILSYETLALDVSWFGTKRTTNADLQKRAFERYNDRVIDLVSRWRALASKAQTLTSPAISDAIGAFLNRVFVEQDGPLVRLYGRKASGEEWDQQHEKNVTMLREANHLISEMAKDLGLVKTALYGPRSSE